MCFVLFLFVACFGWNFNAMLLLLRRRQRRAAARLLLLWGKCIWLLLLVEEEEEGVSLCVIIRKHFVPNGEWILHPTKIGVTLSLYEWKELKKIIPLFEEREPELRTMDNKVTGED